MTEQSQIISINHLNIFLMAINLCITTILGWLGMQMKMKKFSLEYFGGHAGS